MSAHSGAAQDATFVRTYTLTRGRTRPRYLLGLETVLESGPGRAAPGHAQEREAIVALCRERRRSVSELAGRLGRPVTAVKVLISDLLDANALIVPATTSRVSSGTPADDRPSTQLLMALSAGLKRKWPDAVAYSQAG